MIHIVCGPPCAGKSTYIKSNRKPKEIIIDLDAIANAIGGPAHMSKGAVLNVAICGRNAMIDSVIGESVDAWIIDSKPSDESIRKYRNAGAEIVKIDPGKAVCVERAKNRPAGTTEAIHRWYETVNSGFDELHKIRPATVITPTAAERDLRHQSVAERRITMTRAEISNIFPGATSEQIDQIMAINGSDINGIRGELSAVNGQLAEAQSRITELEAADQSAALQEAQANVSQLQSELDTLKAADKVRQIRETVAAAHKVPVNLLTGETEEACTEQAKNILAFAKPGSYPNVPDGGSPAGGNGGSTREQFARWAEQNT